MKCLWLLCIVVAVSRSIHREEEYFHWCGDRLNPLQQAKAMRLATELMYSCKDHIIRLNVSPAILRTLSQFRTTYMHCIRTMLYTSETLNPELFRQYRANVTAILDATARCADHMVPQDVRYTLGALGFFKDFISG